MKYYQVAFDIQPYSETAGDVLMSLLADTGFETFVPDETGFTAYVQQAQYAEGEVREIIENFVMPDCRITFRTEEAPDEDWNQAWEEEGFEPIVLGQDICIHDTRHNDVPPCRYDILINPRMAFGTGTHPTTQQILRQLLAMPLKGLRVVDAGCGTGVLGLLARMRDAERVFSYDIDSWSVENTQVNAQLNGIDRLEVREGDAGVLREIRNYDLLIANINRNILLADLPSFSAALKPRAQLLLSGFYEEDAPLLLEKGKEFGFTLERQTAQEGWAMLLLRRG